MMNENYPPGVTSAHAYFNPPLCPGCGNEATEGDECRTCGDYVPDPSDYDDIRGDEEFERLRDEEAFE